MTRLRIFMSSMGALSLFATPLVAQDSRLVERFPPAVVARLQLVIDSTLREGLPSEPLILRALEGSAKRATPDQIMAVLARLHAALRTARATLGPAAGAPELNTVANAFEAGVPISRLAELRQLRDGQTLTAPLGAYLDLVARGASPDRAWNRIADLAKHRAADAAYVKLSPTDLDQDPPQAPGTNHSDEGAAEDAWTMFTGSGSGQLDQLAGGSISAFGGSLNQPFGAFRVRLDGATAEHAGLGSTGVIGAEIRYPFSHGAWQVDVGPSFASGRDVRAPWQNAAGVLARATRSIGAWSVSTTLRGGFAWQGTRKNLWAGHAVSAGVRVGDFRFGGSWQGATTADSSFQSKVLVVDTLPAPIDSVPHPTGGIVVRQRYDSTYRERNRDLNDLSVVAAWGRGPLSLRARIGRRLGIDQPGETWWALGGTVRLTGAVGLTVNASRTPSDPVLHLRGEHAATIGLRLSKAGGTPQLPVERSPPKRVEIHRLSAQLFHLIFTIPNAAHSAAIAGDVTGWHTKSLARRSDGRWEIMLPASPGVYRINIQRDDGPWEAPPGVPATTDGYGGTVGLLVLDP
jgi:hypothetical protein